MGISVSFLLFNLALIFRRTVVKQAPKDNEITRFRARWHSNVLISKNLSPSDRRDAGPDRRVFYIAKLPLSYFIRPFGIVCFSFLPRLFFLSCIFHSLHFICLSVCFFENISLVFLVHDAYSFAKYGHSSLEKRKKEREREIPFVYLYFFIYLQNNKEYNTILVCPPFSQLFLKIVNTLQNFTNYIKT